MNSTDMGSLVTPQGQTLKKLARKYAVGGGVDKVHRVMGEFKRGRLHSGAKKGPTVKNRKQAIAIALSEKRKQLAGKYAAGGGVPQKSWWSSLQQELSQLAPQDQSQKPQMARGGLYRSK